MIFGDPRRGPGKGGTKKQVSTKPALNINLKGEATKQAK
tara:strand:+ start:814 stop:930 length:117 start_codon:yes stop_codon:yes gene_type:complete